MQGYHPVSSFGPEQAARYDDDPRGDESSAVEFLFQTARGGRALEFAIGTGRIALPLAAKGTPVDGIELSNHMIERLRGKPGGEHIHVLQGDMSVVSTGQTYSLVYLVFNTIFNLLSADDQIRCFENAARHLSADGRFVVEAALPHAWISPGKAEYVRAERIETGAVWLDVARYDPATQLFEENHVCLTSDGVRMNPILCRLISPGEMDLMARIAGLRLVERYGNWQRTPFGADSVFHVSVYGPT